MIDERHLQHTNKQNQGLFFSFIQKGKQKHRNKNERKKEDEAVNTTEIVKTSS